MSFRRCTLCVVLVVVVLFTAGATVRSAAQVRTRIDEICGRILAEPAEYGLDDRIEVHRLRQQLAKTQRRGYQGLVSGLKAYLDGRHCDASEYLAQAVEVDIVASFADDGLGGRLGAIVAQCQEQCQAGVCEQCGGGGVDDCGACAGVGWKVCRRCRGEGRISAKDARRQRGAAEVGGPIVCELCYGLGVVRCEKCSGQGLAVCGLIGEAGHSAEHFNTSEKILIESVIAEAKYLLGGGVDVFTQRALKMAPRVR